ncbi:MAG TPA: PDZ domain-containing protein, partial [Vicinamibacterales bacterium]|nr:PDZ domain-containing protein [Vicinamibacterales bacterium]
GAVVPGSRAAAAGIQSGDRVVRLGQRAPESLEQVRRALDARTGAAIFVEIERAGRRRAALVTRQAR